MVVNETSKGNKSVRPKQLPSNGSDSKVTAKVEKKHRLKQRFEVIKKLGQGTYGKVQLAINKETGQEVAIKTIKKSKVESDQDLIRIRREIQIMSSIQHPHIIHIFEVFENKDKIVLVMQYASGGEVYDYVSFKKVLTDSEARRLFRQIATAIYYCHKNKICHRDLKLENILLDEKGNAKIADFGLSNVFDERHFLQTFCGSPLYASPEIVKGSPYYGPEVDCWSLGVLLYTLVYGAMPFDGSNFKRLVKQISESNYYEPKQKSDASALIKRLLTPNPTERATIIDICTDWWVNRGYEHSLLQVAEDMANLTPVRLDILLALAPVSPSAEQIGKNPFDVLDNKNKDSCDKSHDDMDNLGESADDKSSSNVSVLDNNLKKRQASTSFDQSLSTIPTPTQTQTPRKKKTKKSQNDSSTSKVSSDKPAESLEVSATKNDETSDAAPNTDQPRVENPITEPEQLEQLKESHKTQEIQENDVVQASDQITEQIETENTQIDNLDNSLIVTTEPESASTLSKPEQVSAQISDVVNETSQLNQDLRPKESQKELKETVEAIVADKQEEESSQSLSNQSNSNDRIIANQSEETKVESIVEAQNKDEKPIAVEESSENKDESSEVQTGDKKKTKITRSSSGRRPGKLSIPNLWDKANESSSTKSPETQSNESKKTDTKPEKKAPFIPVGFRVSDAKRAFERRCSVPANSLLQTTASFNKRRESKPSTDLKEANDVRVRQRAPKLSTRSLSCNEMLESPKKVQEINSLLTNKNEKIDETVEVVNQNENEKEVAIPQQTSTQEEKNENISVSSPSAVTDKNMAKDILKKQIAKAKLMEKRQNSSSSGSSSPVTTPLVSIENSNVCITQEPSYLRTPRPFVKEELEKPTIQTQIEIKAKPDLNQKTDENESIPKELDLKIRKPGFDKEMFQSVSQEDNTEKLDSPLPQQVRATPIARSYKKVTFTKDGATITETGKIYSSEGADGSYTRVEKKSKVTHFPTIEGDGQSQPSTGSDNKYDLQRSDSQSSSGSTDIFDDIFDDHWCGDSIFPNMKSLLHGIIGNKKDRKTRRRSRAESCERNNSDWFTSGYSSRMNSSALTDQESDNDDHEGPFSKSVWPTSRLHGSIFDKPSILSRHFSKEFEKSFGGIDDLTQPLHEFNRSLSRDRSSFSSRIHPTSFKVVFGSQPSARPESDDVYASASRSSSSKFETGPRSKLGEQLRTRSREHDIFHEREPNSFAKHDSFDSSRKRVEQWLQTDNNEETEDIDRKAPFSMYATVGPRGVRRYLRTISGRSNDKQIGEHQSPSVNSTVYRNSTSGPQQINPVYPTTSSTVPSDSVVEMRFSFNPANIDKSKMDLNSSTNLSDLNSISISNCQTSEPSECSDDYQSSIVLPESSSLLDQLRTHGYRNIVTQRLSGSSLFSDLDSNLTENDTSYKRGKSVLNCSSSVLIENANACECMDKTNIMATTNGSAAAAHTFADSNNELKASESITSETQVEFADSDLQPNNDIKNMSLKHTVNQQSCESSTRITHSERSNTYGDLPECNPTLKLNKATNNNDNNVTLKETVQERIHRKSFYSRFNDDRSTLTPRQRRRSFIDPEEVDLAFGTRLPSRKSSSRSSSSFRNSLSLDNHSFVSSKPPFSSSDWFNRMESRASQLMDDLMANDRISVFREELRNRELPEENYSFERRRRSSSSTRSSFSTPRSNKSDFEPYFNSFSNSILTSRIDNDDDEETEPSHFNNLLGGITSPTEVLQRAIDILSQKD